MFLYKHRNILSLYWLFQLTNQSRRQQIIVQVVQIVGYTLFFFFPVVPFDNETCMIQGPLLSHLLFILLVHFVIGNENS